MVGNLSLFGDGGIYSLVYMRRSHSVPGSGRSPGGGHGNPRQYLGLENPWTEEPGRLQSMGLQRVGHDLATKQQWSINTVFSIDF